MNESIWIGSLSDVRYNSDADAKLKEINDAKYWNPAHGITSVDHNRWLMAQQFEEECWMKHCLAAASDRLEEHIANFENYISIQNEDLGKTIEIGCGPFTQLQGILHNNGNIQSITLIDPLLDKYLLHPNCTYKSDELCGIPIVSKQSIQAEEFTQAGFDTAICINVLEHVENANIVLDNLYNCLKTGGIIIFSERDWDSIDINRLYDAGHPIRLKSPVINEFTDKFKTIFKKNGYFIGQKQV